MDITGREKKKQTVGRSEVLGELRVWLAEAGALPSRQNR